jgi:putative transposase
VPPLPAHWPRPLDRQRLHRTALKGYADGREARAGIAAWIAFYNGRRPHQALGNRTPMAIWREGVTGLLADNAVDMTLRLDDARASPTCPQRQLQQQQTTCAA